MLTLYLAGPLFSEAERDWLTRTISMISERAAQEKKRLKIIWPYELISRAEVEALGDRARREIFNRCRDGLDRSGCLVALLDGVQVDDGAAWEIGYFYARRPEGAKILGIRTDFRRAGETADSITNAMIELSCDRIFFNREELVDHIMKMCDPD